MTFNWLHLSSPPVRPGQSVQSTRGAESCLIHLGHSCLQQQQPKTWPIINLLDQIYVGNKTPRVHHTSWMSRTSWYLSLHFPKGYSARCEVVATRVGMPGEAPHMSRRRLFIAEKNLMMFIPGQKPFYCKQMLQPVGRFWRQGYGPLPPTSLVRNYLRKL